MKPRQLLQRITRGDVRNIAFDELVILAQALGFEEIRIRGSHYVFVHHRTQAILNIPAVRGEALPGSPAAATGRAV